MPSHNKPSKANTKPRTTILKVLEEDEKEAYDYAVLVLGATGVGKSTLCNFFIGEDKFESVPGLISGTSSCNVHCHPVNGKNVMFIDSPGFSDTIVSNKERMQEMSKALLLARNGVHAIIVCLNGEGRFSEADLGLINEMKKLEINESQSIWAYTFVLFTHGRSMGKTESQRNEKIQEYKCNPNCPPLFLELLSKVQDRYMIVESLMENESYHAQKCDELVHFIEKVYADNNRACYTHRLFAWARDKYEEAVQKQIDKKTIQQQDVINNQVKLLEQKHDLIKRLGYEKHQLTAKFEETKDELHKAELQLKDNEYIIDKQEEKIKNMEKNETLKIQDAFDKLAKIKEEKKKLEEIIGEKRKECTEKTRVIEEKQDDIKKEKESKQKIQEELQKEQETMTQLEENAKKLLQKRQIKGDPTTLMEALQLMIQDIDSKLEQLAAKDTELSLKVEQLATKEDEVTELTKQIQNYSVFGIPIPFTKRKLIVIGLGPRIENKKKS